MSKDLHDKLNETPANAVPVDSYTDEQIGQLVIQLAITVRALLFDKSMTIEENLEAFTKELDKMPDEIRDRVTRMVIDDTAWETDEKPFWVDPSDAVLTVEYGAW